MTEKFNSNNEELRRREEMANPEGIQQNQKELRTS